MRALTLALEASTYSGSAAVFEAGQLIAQGDARMRGRDEERLMPLVAAVLSQCGAGAADVGRVVCGQGPGSFTSLRIAASIAKGIVTAGAAELYAVSSLLLVVAGAPLSLPAGDYLVALDAMRGDCFVQRAAMRPDGRIDGDDVYQLLSTEQLDEELQLRPARVIGPGQPIDAAPHARGAGRLIESRLAHPVQVDAWEPVYGRAAEAQVRWEAANARPLPR